MIEGLKRVVSAALGSPIRSHARAHGGDINEAFEVTLTDGRRVFIKTNARADRRILAAQPAAQSVHPSPRARFAHPSVFSCEARGLDWLREANALRVPRVLAFTADDDGGDTPPFLALEHIASASRAADFDERLGRGLAALHQSGAPCFGFDESNFIGSLTQDNTACETWPAFYVERRLDPMVRAAVDRGRAPAAWTRTFARLFARMDDLAGAAEPPARLHGDLWSGNVMADETGAPCLIDPAVYGGHREIDLAMLRLFGGLGPRVLAAYREAAPLASGYESRVALYQLYPLLVHVNLFGGGYVASVERALGDYV